eukprot:TRINITY_DN3603_c1_g1_i5.p1 TRINITY_DN3603_c1_g1~~TRINITY_DN3603_c1_g1_i5.p1  ORF type:complete len:472 (-),score=46.42 TRINITY_DN3603_c1_g1_i5:1472-2887(-)
MLQADLFQMNPDTDLSISSPVAEKRLHDDSTNSAQSSFAPLDASVCILTLADVRQHNSAEGWKLSRFACWPIENYPSMQNCWLGDDLILITLGKQKFFAQTEDAQQSRNDQAILPSVLSKQILAQKEQIFASFDTDIKFKQLGLRDLRLRFGRYQKQADSQECPYIERTCEYTPARNGFAMILNVDFLKDVQILNVLQNEPMCYEAYWENEFVKIKMLGRQFQMEGGNQFVTALKREMEQMESSRYGGILRVYGACLIPPTVCIIEELSTDYLNLYNYYLHQRQFWRYLNVLQVSHMMAQALEALHRKIPHGDIRLQNFLIKPPIKVKLTNYIMMAREHYNYGDKQEFEADDIWSDKVVRLAPDVLTTGQVSKCADIYAFGVVLWELISGCGTSDLSQQAAQLRQARKEGRELPLQFNWPQNFKNILKACLNTEATLRPTASQLVCMLYMELCTYTDPNDPRNGQPVAQFL